MPLFFCQLFLARFAQYQRALLVFLRDPRRLDLEVPLLPGLIKCCEDRHEQGLGRARRRLWPVREKILITTPRRKLPAAEKKA